ncbi:MAG: ATP-binding protein, partial [Phycisphaeraceae bacterium]|nr:ATP-binding protein [Phycisphaeraceae bacterium]
ARAKHIELLDLSTSVAPAIFADRDMIYQVLINLVGNAIKYTPEDSNGRVTVTAGLSTDASMIQVAVRDNGVGIASDAAPHVFDKFYRVPDHKTLAKGTGLGLNLVRQIIETVHDGVIGVESTPGAGSTFTFALPFAE